MVEISKALVFNPSFIGDAILTTPLVNAVKQLFPTAQVDLCVRPESVPLFKGLCDNVIALDKRGIHSGYRGAKFFAEELKTTGYDLVVTPHKSIRSMLILDRANIPIRVGFKESVGSSIFLTHSVGRDMSLHEIERNLSLLTTITDDLTTRIFNKLAKKVYTYLDFNHYANAKRYMNIISGAKPVVGIAPGSVWYTKRWPVTYFCGLAEILDKNGYAIAILGGPSDKKETDSLMIYLDEVGINYFDYADKVSFEYYPAIVKSLDLLVTNDSAPMHVAVSQEVPTVAIFGATTPELGFGPFDEMSFVCEVLLSCRPCEIHGGKRCPVGHFKCMLDITPEAVYNAVVQTLGKK